MSGRLDALVFGDFVEKSNGIADIEELFAHFERTAASFGLDKVLFACVTDHRDIGVRPENRFRQNYPSDWMSYYFEHGYDKIDPVPLYGLSQHDGYFWKEIAPKMDLNRMQKKCLEYGEESGLYNGMSIPLRGPNHSLAGFSLASSEQVDSFDKTETNRAILTAMCNHFYARFRKICEEQQSHNKNINVKNYALNQKQLDILHYAAIGKTNEDIGFIMNMSEHTVDWNFRQIYKTLEANSRVLAITKAITFGLIFP